MSIEDIHKYELYLQIITKKLKEFFDEQSPYICCKEGCSLCCETGEYPFTEIEVKYLMIGFAQLSPDIKKQILEKTQEIIFDKQKAAKDKKFMHACPFLVDHRCSVYPYRGIICRTHGLAFYDDNQRLSVPHCVCDGLNYANVYDFDKQCISKEKFEQSGLTIEPLAHNIGLKFLTNNDFVKRNNLKFGEIKPLIDWLTAE